MNEPNEDAGDVICVSAVAGERPPPQAGESSSLPEVGSLSRTRREGGADCGDPRESRDKSEDERQRTTSQRQTIKTLGRLPRIPSR